MWPSASRRRRGVHRREKPPAGNRRTLRAVQAALFRTLRAVQAALFRTLALLAEMICELRKPSVCRPPVRCEVCGCTSFTCKDFTRPHERAPP